VEPFNDTEPISFLANFYSLSHKLSNRVKDILLAEELPAKGVSFCHLPDTRAPGAGIGRKPTTLCEKKLSQEELLQSVDEGHRISTLAVDGS
jgi:hypothetical protein